jgi:hypothetical protein
LFLEAAGRITRSARRVLFILRGVFADMIHRIAADDDGIERLIERLEIDADLIRR